MGSLTTTELPNFFVLLHKMGLGGKGLADNTQGIYLEFGCVLDRHSQLINNGLG